MSTTDDEKWLDAVRDKIKDYEEQPPIDDWSAIEKSLPDHQPAKFRTLSPRVSAIAAAVLLLIGISLFLHHNEATMQTARNPRQTVSAQSVPSASTSSIASVPASPPSSQLIASAAPSPSTHDRISSYKNPVNRMVPTASDASSSAVITTDADTSSASTSAAQSKETIAVETARAKASGRQPRISLNSSENAMLASAGSHSRSSFALSLHAASSAPQLYADNNSTTMMSYSDVCQHCDGGYVSSQLSSVDYTHHLPVQIGIEVEKKIGRKLGLASGLTFTYMNSSCSLPDNAEDISQHVYYIGVPLRLNYYFHDRRNFSAYWSNGIEVDKCVHAKMGDAKLGTGNWQYSVSTSLGLQYRLSTRFSIYAEPGISYYTTSGTSIETYRTRNPFSVDLQIGLKLNY